MAGLRDKLDMLCRYISRPAVSEKRLALTTNDKICYQLKTPYRDGTTYVIFEPLNFTAKLAAKPHRFHGVLVSNNKHRVEVMPVKRSKRKVHSTSPEKDWLEMAPEEHHQAMTWMQRLKRVFNMGRSYAFMHFSFSINGV